MDSKKSADLAALKKAYDQGLGDFIEYRVVSVREILRDRA